MEQPTILTKKMGKKCVKCFVYGLKQSSKMRENKDCFVFLSLYVGEISLVGNK